jgi:hypothetical protein
MQTILSALQSISRQGSFCAKQTVSNQDLQITVKNFPTQSGTLKLPLSTRAARSLIKLAKPAKFGWKDQTLLDPKVRDVWEIPKSNIKIDNRRWKNTLNPALDAVKSQLGLPPESRLKAHLHNMLVYQPGQFFTPHQDSEKLDGMVATLVVVLPSSYRGGALVIDHQGEKKRFQAARSAGDKLSLIAFYADCHHEVTPVTEGYRVTLTYNLVLDNKNRKAFAPTQNIAAATALEKGLRDYFNPPSLDGDEAGKSWLRCGPRKWVYLLDHQYTRKSLRWHSLKNEDQARVDTLVVLSNKLDLVGHLALADIQETWDCEDDYDWRQRSGRRRYWRDWDEEEDEEDIAVDNDGYTLNDLIERNTALAHWIDENNRPVEYSGLHIRDGEICWTKATDEFDPFQSDYEGFMGNYGNTLDRWYHRAAIVLWRREDHYAVLCELNAKEVVKHILQLAKKAENLAQAQQLTASILPYWNNHARHTKDPKLANTVFKLAWQIQSDTLAQGLLVPLGLNALTPQTAKMLIKLEDRYHTSWCLDLLQSWTEKKDSYHHDALITDFSRIISALTEKSQRKSGLTGWLLKYQFAVLKERDNHQRKHLDRRQLAEKASARLQTVIELLSAAFSAGDKKIHEQVLKHAAADENLYSRFDLATIVQHFARELSGEDFQHWGYGDLRRLVAGRLEAEIKKGARKGGDWSIRETSSCTCQDCASLKQFLLSPANTLTWPLKKERRAHMHRVIDGLGIPVTHETLRQGSPQKLVLTKTKQLFVQDRQRLEQVKDTLSALQSLED